MQELSGRGLCLGHADRALPRMPVRPALRPAAALATTSQRTSSNRRFKADVHRQPSSACSQPTLYSAKLRTWAYTREWMIFRLRGMSCDH